VVNYLTKSGTNTYHGSGFEFYEGNWGESFAQGQKSPYFGFCAAGVAAGTNGCVTPTLPRFVQNKLDSPLAGQFLTSKTSCGSFQVVTGFDSAQAGGESLSGPSTVTPDATGLTSSRPPSPVIPA